MKIKRSEERLTIDIRLKKGYAHITLENNKFEKLYLFQRGESYGTARHNIELNDLKEVKAFFLDLEQAIHTVDVLEKISI